MFKMWAGEKYLQVVDSYSFFHMLKGQGNEIRMAWKW